MHRSWVPPLLYLNEDATIPVSHPFHLLSSMQSVWTIDDTRCNCPCCTSWQRKIRNLDSLDIRWLTGSSWWSSSSLIESSFDLYKPHIFTRNLTASSNRWRDICQKRVAYSTFPLFNSVSLTGCSTARLSSSNPPVSGMSMSFTVKRFFAHRLRFFTRSFCCSGLHLDWMRALCGSRIFDWLGLFSQSSSCMKTNSCFSIWPASASH